MYSCYILMSNSRILLLKKFTPLFKRSVAHHITYQFGSDKLPPLAKLEVIGHANDDKIECLVVAVDGNTTRIDGSTYHITWSLDPSSAKPVMSNDLLRKKIWTPVESIEIQAIPTVEK